MTIQIDGIIFSLQRFGGVTVYFRELLNHLEILNINACLSVERPEVQDISGLTEGVTKSLRLSRAFERFRSCRLISQASVFHSSYYRIPERRNLPTVVTVHDFTYERFRRGPAKWAHILQKHEAIRQAQSIICISESTRDDLIEFVGVRADQKLHVIPNGVGDIFKPLALGQKNRPFMLFVGDRREYKNFKLALGALEFLPDFELHCVGGGEFKSEEFLDYDDNLRERVRHHGFITDDALNLLYNKAVCLVYPSRYEGFGIPVVEAMKTGCPVISINCKAVIEVGADALEILDDDEPVALANAVMRLSEPTYRNHRISVGLRRAQLYSWKNCHTQTIEVYRSLAEVSADGKGQPSLSIK